MMIVRKSFFTLLELLVVLLILSLGAALTGIKIKDAYEEQRFLSEVSQIANHLQMAQDLMLIMQTDTTIKFNKKGEQFSYRICVEKPLSKWWTPILGKEYALKAIRSVKFEGELMPVNDADLALLFFSKGMAMSQGKLVLAREKDQVITAQQIILPGYPSFMRSESYQEGRESKKSLRDDLTTDLYPKTILEEADEKDPPDDKTD
jgi:prepilin-type N-terminal cleavage/methylation domain-containing protein